MRLGPSQLERHLNRGRDRLAHARRSLSDLDIDQALNQIEDAVRFISRAREQLFDPDSVAELASEQRQLLQQTGGLAQVRAAEKPKMHQQFGLLAGWMEGSFLGFKMGLRNAPQKCTFDLRPRVNKHWAQRPRPKNKCRCRRFSLPRRYCAQRPSKWLRLKRS